jgi:hypothetical protein
LLIYATIDSPIKDNRSTNKVCPTSPPMRLGRYVFRGRIVDNRPNDCVSYHVALTTHDDIIMECNDNQEDSDIPSNNSGEPNSTTYYYASFF